MFLGKLHKLIREWLNGFLTEVTREQILGYKNKNWEPNNSGYFKKQTR